MQQYTDTQAVTIRLKRIEGQIRGIIKMAEEGKSCEELLIQIGSAKAGLQKAGQIMLERHIQHCVSDGIREDNEEETIKKLTSALEQFSRII